MHAKIFAGLLGLAALMAPAFADAQVYIAGDVGYHAPKLDSTSIADGFLNTDLSLKNNGAGFARLGYELPLGLRVELEFGYRPSTLNGPRTQIVTPLIISPLPRLTGGHDDTESLMANAIYDIPVGFILHPFIGAGVGGVRGDLKTHGNSIICPVCVHPDICVVGGCFGSSVNVDDSVDRFGWQAIGGISWPFAPDLALDLTYRYLQADSLTWTGHNAVFVGTTKVHANYTDNSVTAGLRFFF